MPWHRYRHSLQPLNDLRDILRPPARRVAALDGVRAIGILLVIALHCVFGISRLLEPERRLIFIEGLPTVLNSLWQARGSDIIFLLCGLLVTHTLLKNQERQSRLDVGRFYRRRLGRLLPLYLLALALYLPFDRDGWENLWSNLLFISNLIPGQHNIVPVGWSMNIQIQFYALLPWLLILLLKSTRPLLWLGALIVLALLLKAIIVLQTPLLRETPFHTLFDDKAYSSLYANTLYYNLHTRITPFLLGIGLAWLWQRPAATLQARLQTPWVSTALLLGGTALVIATTRIGIHNPLDAFYQPFDADRNTLHLILNRPLFCLGLALLVLCALFPAGLAKRWADFLSLRIWHPLSELVYGIYLFHFPCILLAAVLLFGSNREAFLPPSAAELGMLFALATLFSLLFAALVAVLVEKPCIRLFGQGRTA